MNLESIGLAERLEQHRPELTAFCQRMLGSGEAEDAVTDGICIDTDGAIWTGSGASSCVRVGGGGEVLDRIELDGMPFACILGGPGRRTLFVMVADWDRSADPGDNMARLTTGPRTGQIVTIEAPAPGAGWP